MCKEVKHYKIAWDNGANASDEFPTEYANAQDALNAGQDWADEMNALEPIPEGDDGYTYEVVRYFEDGSYEFVNDDQTKQVNTDLDYTLCDILGVCMDELDMLPMEEVERLRKVVKVSQQISQKGLAQVLISARVE